MRERNPTTHEEKLAYLGELREQAVHSASEEAVEKQHAKGKLTARERAEELFSPGSSAVFRTDPQTSPTPDERQKLIERSNAHFAQPQAKYGSIPL